MMKLILFFLFSLHSAQALECQSPSITRRTEGDSNTLHTWCELNGIREGGFESFSVQDGVTLKAYYKNGQLDGGFQRFYPGGKVSTEGYYTQNQMSGPWTRYWENGKKRDHGTWSKDKPVGRWLYYKQDGKIEREVVYDNEGKIVKVRKPSTKLRSSSLWRVRAGVARADVSRGNHEGEHVHVGAVVGLDLRLFEWPSWLRGELLARIVPEYYVKTERKVYSGQLSLGLDLFPAFFDPFVLTVKLGPHFTNFQKVRGSGGLGLRYQWNNKWGVFLEGTGMEYHRDEFNYSYSTEYGYYGDEKREGGVGTLGLTYAL